MTASDEEGMSDDFESSPSVSELFDVSLESNYEEIKKKIAERTAGGYNWTTLSSEPLLAGKKVIRERKVQLFASPETTQNIQSQFSSKKSVNFHIQERFKSAWLKHFKDREIDGKTFLTTAQQEIIVPLANQMDISVLSQEQEKAIDVEDEYRSLYCLQAMQMAMTARTRILKHTASSETSSERDQGFTRPQTLIILPFRNAAFDCIKFMASLWKDRNGGGSGTQVENLSRFEEEYGPEANDDDDEQDKEAKSRDRRPAAFKHLFRDNIDDCFRIGIKFTRKSMKLFADFYSADIIIASPLGLRLVVDGADKNMKSGGDWDFLSSIELLVIDQADTILMQNWEHLQHILAHVNRIPKKSHGCDFSRVRSIFLDGAAQNVRQTLLFSKFPQPEINSLINTLTTNCIGAFKVSTRGVQSVEQLRSLAVARNSPAFFLLPMKSERTDLNDVMVAARFNFFCGKIIPALMRLLDDSSDGICIYIPSYYDFCQVRAHLKKANDDGLLPDFVHLSEYTSNSDISRARAKFVNGLAKIMIVSERFYFFRRYQLRGIRQLIFYGLPEFPEFFNEWLGMIGNVRKDENSLQDENNGKSRRKPAKLPKAGELDISIQDVPVIIAPLDILKLERIVGIAKARELLE